MPGFFDQPVNQYAPNPEPPETTLIRDLLTRKMISLQADPYGGNQMRPNSAQPAPAFAGSGGGPDQSFFYGSGGVGGSGGGNPGGPTVGPRQSPLRALIQRMTRTLHPRSASPEIADRMDPMQAGGRPSPDPSGSNLGSFFRAMQRFAPPRDSRGPLRQLLALTRAMGQMGQGDGDIGSDEEGGGNFDGANLDTGQLPGFDGAQNEGAWAPMGWQSRYAQGMNSGQKAGAGRLVGGHRNWWDAAPREFSSGPGGLTYTGAGHEFSGYGGQGEAFARQRDIANSLPGNTLNEFFRSINKRQVMGQSPGMTSNDYESQMAAIQARHAAANRAAGLR